MGDVTGMQPPISRQQAWERLGPNHRYDVAVVGGGATGLGVALEAVSRGLKVALVEMDDFASGTSSRATKLVHGGVRYLAQGHLGLVYQALHERTTLIANAPHVAHALPFVVPCHAWWHQAFYGLGLTAYRWLAGRHSLGATEWLNKAQTLQALPGLSSNGLRAGVRYWDGQFDDARMAIALARTAAAQGAVLLNHCKATSILQNAGRAVGVQVQDALTGRTQSLQADCIVNATGVWVDGLRQSASPLVRPSKGVHLVVDASFLPGTEALMIPKTSDGRVLFAVPWLGSVILGTTDTPTDAFEREPQAESADVDFILQEASKVLRKAPTRADVRSCWAGLRPLVQPQASSENAKAGQATRTISREHTIEHGNNQVLHVTGGKWTTYRAMAEDVLAAAIEQRLLPSTAPRQSRTRQLTLLGADSPCNNPAQDAAQDVEFVRYATEYEFATTTTDVLARRSRLLFLDAHQAQAIAPVVAGHLEKLGFSSQLEPFLKLARQYAHPR